MKVLAHYYGGPFDGLSVPHRARRFTSGRFPLIVVPSELQPGWHVYLGESPWERGDRSVVMCYFGVYTMEEVLEIRLELEAV